MPCNKCFVFPVWRDFLCAALIIEDLLFYPFFPRIKLQIKSIKYFLQPHCNCVKTIRSILSPLKIISRCNEQKKTSSAVVVDHFNFIY